MGIITNPIETIKNQALKIWATKDYAERLAFNRTTWFLHLMYVFGFIMVLHLFTIVIINDIFTLYNFYNGSNSSWFVGLLEEIYFSIHPLIEISIIFFWVSPKLVRFTLGISKAYSNKEKAIFEWIEFRIKRRFPSYKTSTQRARERLDSPKKKGKLNVKFKKFMDQRNDVERLIIRGCIWGCYLLWIGSFIFFMLSITSSGFNELMNPEEAEIAREELEEIQDEIELLLEEQPPTRPDSLPPPTIFDVFISKPDTVIP